MTEEPQTRHWKGEKRSREALIAALAQRERELAEARQRERATAEVINVISRSQVDLEAVLARLTDSARTLCGAANSAVHMCDGNLFRIRAHAGCSPEFVAFQADHPVDPASEGGGRTHIGRAALTGKVAEIADVFDAPDRFQLGQAPQLGNFRAILGVPLVREGKVEGIFSLARPEPGRFAPEQIELVCTFADQAMIAIENARLFDEAQAKTRDLEEALQQQTATADVLKIISRSAFDLQAVFDTLLSSAATLCGAIAGNLWLRDGDFLRQRATFGQNPNFAKYLAEHQQRPSRELIAGRVLLSGRTEEIPDTLSDAEYAAPALGLTDARSVLGVPLLRGDVVEGAIVLLKREPGPFAPRQIELVKTFADQALIAIENVRLFDEVQVRTRDLEESLAQQTATADVLRVISRSAFDLDVVLKTLTESARSLSGAAIGAVFMRDGEVMRIRAESGFPPVMIEYALAHPIRPGRETFTGRVALTGEVVHIPDVLADPDYDYGEGPRLGDYRAGIGVPLIRDGRVDGVFSLMRPEPGAFAPRQIELVRTFADQAVIAIENARLFEEVQARTGELEEALRQQTATAEVLKVISRSAFDLDAVLKTLTDSARSLSGAATATVLLRDGETLLLRAESGCSPEFRDYMVVNPPRMGRETGTGRVLMTAETVHIPDVLADPDYNYGAGPRVGNYRAQLGVPLIRDGKVEGVFGLLDPEPGAFTPRQIELVRTFADQAVIAIENARLFNEVQARTRDIEEALKQQTATADVLKVISRSAFDLQTVLDTLVSSAVSLCGAAGGLIFLQSGDTFQVKAATVEVESRDAELLRRLRATPQRPGRGTVAARVLSTGEVQNIADVQMDPDYDPDLRSIIVARALLGVPLKRGDAVIGAVALRRAEPGAFSQRQIELVQTFADQAVIAIENIRLFDEVQARTRDLNEALQQQTATSEILRVISQSPTDAQPVFDSICSTAVRSLGCDFAFVMLRDGDAFIHPAGATPQGPLNELPGRTQLDPEANFPSRAMLSGEKLYLPDWSRVALPEHERHIRSAFNINCALYLPLLRDGDCIGLLALGGRKADSFGPKEVAQAESFRDQAMIAIENARLFRETQEALEQQKASADVLSAISKSVADTTPVFEEILCACQRLFGGEEIGIYTIGEDRMVRATAWRGPRAEEALRDVTPLAKSVTGRVIRERRPHHIPDLSAAPDLSPTLRDRANRHGSASLLYAPMLWEDSGLGSILVVRWPARRFSDREQALLQSFANQAAIAIQNARLFHETQAKTRDLEESLAQQTATADVLKVISRSAFDLDAVLRTLVESAAKLCDADKATITREIDGVFYRRESYGFSEEFMGPVRPIPVVPERGSITGRAMLEGKAVHVEDVEADPEYWPAHYAKPGELRTGLGIPMMRNGVPIGVLALMRSEVRPFNHKQIELVTTFADQAAIAIENARLFAEVQARTRDLEESLAQQTATADVLKAISRTAFDLDTVLETLISTAVRLCEANYGEIFRRQGDAYRYAASLMDVDPAYREHERKVEIRPGRGTLVGRVALENRPVVIADAWSDPEYEEKNEARIGGVRAMLGVPLLRDGEPIGAFALGRAEPVPFTERQIELVNTFADQAVIAMENARLFEEVQARTRDLEESLAQQTATADVLKVISRSAFDLQAVLDTLIRSAAELSEAATGVVYLQEGQAFHLKAHAGISEDLVGYLKQNPQRPGRGSGGARVLLTGQVQNIPDVQTDEDYNPDLRAAAVRARALLGVPLLRDQAIVGAIVLSRPRPGAFTARQIEIVQTFADQAVIAIENARLFDEVQARTRELTASLDDLRKAQDRLIQSEKLASLGQLTAGIAHEIKNPLNFVNNFSALSRELVEELAGVIKTAPLEASTRDEASELIDMVSANLDKVVQHGKRADSIVKNMLLHSREGSGERSMTNINAMVEEALNLAYHGARAEKPGFNVTITKSLDPNAGAAEVYAQEMTRVLLNLISNGFYATTKRKQAKADEAYEPTLVASTRDLGHSVEIAIRDNGTGIPDDVKAKMFNPFFTTKPAGEGTGLGLSLSHDIVVNQHGGTLEVSTKPGSYTQFSIVLPRAGAGA